MKKKKERTLIYIYLAMLFLSIYLNWSSGNVIEIANILVSTGMFIVVGAVFRRASKCFRAVNKMIISLQEATSQIKADFERKQAMLWDTYKDRDPIFDDEILRSRFREYQCEMKRLAIQPSNSCKCSIEDYINRDIIDKTIEKNILNLVAGAMTALGILGTFIGLSFGLQNFSTGTSDEISDSIGPLMEGIKVAFHTSIYGLVFSLSFNYVYKKKLDKAYDAMDSFLEIYRRYVAPDAQDDNVSMLLLFEHMNETITNFANVATQSQVDGIHKVVNMFISELNQSLGNRFKELENVIEDTCKWQKQNSTEMQAILEKVESMTHNIQEINELSEHAVENLANYVDRIENNSRMSEKQQEYIAAMVEQIQNIFDASNLTTGDLNKAARELSKVSQQLNDQLIHSFNTTFDTFDKNLSEITRHLSGTIAEVECTTERVPQVVSAAYEGMEKSLTKMQNDLEILVYSMDVLRRNVSGAMKLLEED